MEQALAPQQVAAAVLEARCAVAAAARKAGKAAGILATAPAQSPVLREEGFSVLAFGSDGAAVVAGLRQSLAAMRSA